MSEESQARDSLAAFGRSMFERGLSFGSAGNLSMRIDGGWLMTPTNVSLGRLDPARLSKLDDSGRHVGGAIGGDVAVVGGDHQQRREGQRVGRHVVEAAAFAREAGAFMVGRRDEEGALHLARREARRRMHQG